MFPHFSGIFCDEKSIAPPNFCVEGNPRRCTLKNPWAKKKKAPTKPFGNLRWEFFHPRTGDKVTFPKVPYPDSVSVGVFFQE